jgi:flavin-dependent dehydrogenase
MIEVLVVGAGPAGSVAALVLARAGVRVLIVDRATFPRDKLCGDSLNPGTLAELRALGIAEAVERAGLPIRGMLVTSEHGLSVRSTYAVGLTGRTLQRRHLDATLLDAAAAAGARVEFDARVSAPLVDETADRRVVRGALVHARDRQLRLPARVTIAADGRHSTLAFALGLALHPAAPRRWAIGADVAGMTDCGEMHLRRAHYVGVAPLPSGLVNACLVTAARPQLRDPRTLLEQALRADPQLADRFAAARSVSRVFTLGPLAVDCRAAGLPGLLLAGDAAGFIDPMTGDGLRFAIDGGVLAARAALELLENPRAPVWRKLDARRRRRFGAKRVFNRLLRLTALSCASSKLSEVVGPVAGSIVSAIVRGAGDERLARRQAMLSTEAR